MAMSPELRAQRINETREMAAHLFEDIQHMRRVTEKVDPDRRELRDLSNNLTRLLIERDLQAVAAPRVDTITIGCPNNQEVYRYCRTRELPFFCSGGASAFGFEMRACMVTKTHTPPSLKGFNPDETVFMRVDQFLKQGVLCFQSKWASRQDVILYIRHVGYGVHSGKPKERQAEQFAIVERARNSVDMYITIDPQTGERIPTAAVMLDVLSSGERKFSYNQEKIDPALLELLCTARFIVDSEDIQSLESVIRKELDIK